MQGNESPQKVAFLHSVNLSLVQNLQQPQRCPLVCDIEVFQNRRNRRGFPVRPSALVFHMDLERGIKKHSRSDAVCHAAAVAAAIVKCDPRIIDAIKKRMAFFSLPPRRCEPPTALRSTGTCYLPFTHAGYGGSQQAVDAPSLCKCSGRL